MKALTTQDLNNYVYQVQSKLAESNELSLASVYHEKSKRYPQNISGSYDTNYEPTLLPAFSRRAYKTYELAERVRLDEPPKLEATQLDTIILRRRTIRTFVERPLKQEHLSQLLSLSYRVIDPTLISDDAQRFPVRPVPSGGALYPLELYPIVFNVENISPGLYHYHPVQHGLEVLDQVPPTQSSFPQGIIGKFPEFASLAICISGVLPRISFKYGDLGYRLMLLEAGHLAQNLLLVAETLGLGGLPACAFYDECIHDYLNVDGVDEIALYIIWIGWPRLP